MDDVRYISDDIHVRIAEQDPVNVNIEEHDAVQIDIPDATVVYGGLPRGGVYNDILVKKSNRDYHAEWMSMREAGLSHIYYDTTANWNAQRDLISEEGSIYIYSDYYQDGQGRPVPGIKIGDGSAYLIDLPAGNQDLTDRLFDHINNSVIHVSAYDRTFWNNKVTSVIDPADAENLILTKDFVL